LDTLQLTFSVETSSEPADPPWISKKESWTKWLRDYHQSLNTEYEGRYSQKMDQTEPAKTTEEIQA
jgi:hypothetical protein